MRILLLTVTFTFLSLAGNLLHAQDLDSLKMNLREVTVEKRLLPYSNPLVSKVNLYDGREQVTAERNLDSFQKDVMTRIADIYRIQSGIIEAQVAEDPLKAEEQITGALTSINRLLEDYPEIQSDQRFREVYRSVLTEYREFYGVEDPSSEVKGDIFAIRDELFSEEDDWLQEGYAIPEDITTPQTEVPLVQNRQVNNTLMYYTLRRPEVMETWLQRAEKYFPMMEQIFEEENVPKELMHLAMIESGLNPKAQSWASAVGMWQFIRATGSMYGLEVNWWIDERRDPEKSTRAAARHLGDLYEIWGDWHLALAGYNISPRGLKRAINAGGGTEDYWSAYNYLPRETRNYVPGFIAATMVSMNRTEFGFEERYEGTPYAYEVAEVDPLMALEDLAEAAGITTEKLKDYNPELLQWATPPGNKYPLKLPTGTRDRFVSNYEDIPKEERTRNITMHTVSRGENLGYIARKYGTTVRGLFETNENLSSTIHPGQTIVVPIPQGSGEQIAVNQPSGQSSSSSRSGSRSTTSAPANTASVTYTVKSGDTVGHIAEWYDVRAWQIRGWNGIGNVIRLGQKLTIHVPENDAAYYRQVDSMDYSRKQSLERQQRSGVDIMASARSATLSNGTYTVKRNDTLSGIADAFGVTVATIKEINNLEDSRIFVGQTLKIQQPN